MTERVAATIEPYTPIFLTGGRMTSATGTSGVDYMLSPSASDFQVAQNVSGANVAGAVFYFANALYLQTGRTLTMRLRVAIHTVATAPAITITFTLNPLTIASSSFVKGTAVSGSTATLTTPAGNAITTADSTDFTIPSDGLFGVCYTLSAAPSSNATFDGRVLVHNT